LSNVKNKKFKKSPNSRSLSNKLKIKEHNLYLKILNGNKLSNHNISLSSNSM